MATKKLRAELEVDTTKAKQKVARDFAETGGAAAGGGGAEEASRANKNLRDLGNSAQEASAKLNGMGKLMIGALMTADSDIIILLQMFYVAVSLIGNLIIDLVYGLVDPRIRVSA